MASRKIASTKSVKTSGGGSRVTTSEVEVVEVKKGMGWEGGMAIITTIVLIIAILCVDKDLGSKFGAGMFFK